MMDRPDSLPKYLGVPVSCETCVHSGHHPETGELFCLGPAPVIFCEDVEQPCEFWEEAEENDGTDL